MDALAEDLVLLMMQGDRRLLSRFAKAARTSWPDMDGSARLYQDARSFFVQLFNMLPDLDLVVVSRRDEDPSHGVLEYSLSGTCAQANGSLPMFPVGRWVDWVFTSRFEFDAQGMIRTHKVRFGLPAAAAAAAHFEGLARCARPLALTSGGSRLLQDALFAGAADDRSAPLLRALQPRVWELSLSATGNHVLQKCIVSLFPAQVQFVVDAFIGRAAEAARSPLQSRILERLLAYVGPQQTGLLADEVLAQAEPLLVDPFGNFVLQAILEYGAPHHRSNLVAILKKDLHRLARDAVASNVVRTALVYASPEDRDALVEAMKANAQRFASLAKHKTGSFVVREMKRVTKLSA